MAEAGANASSGGRGPMICVEVAYALPERQILIALQVEKGTTAREAIERSGLLAQCPGIDLSSASVGIFGRIVDLSVPLASGDRVEIYRKLLVEPRESRRARERKSRGR